MFHGFFGDTESTRKYPVIRSIHLQVTNGRRRFASYARESFYKFLNLLQQRPELQNLLKDQNVNKAPPEYLAAVEEGLRLMGQISEHTMGGGAMKSKERWAQVESWRKREVGWVSKSHAYLCFIACVLVFNCMHTCVSLYQVLDMCTCFTQASTCVRYVKHALPFKQHNVCVV